jgi:hypothetical protein
VISPSASDFHASECETLEETCGVFLIPAESVQRLRKHNVESSVQGVSHERLEAGAKQCGSRGRRFNRLGDDADGMIGEQVLGSDLHDARRGFSAGRKDCREVQVVRDENELVLVAHVRISTSGAVAAPMVDQWTASNPSRASRSTQLGDRFMSTSSFTVGAEGLRLPLLARRRRIGPR